MSSSSEQLDRIAQVDKAGREYWDQVWEGQSIAAAFEPGKRNRHNYAEQAFHHLFSRQFGGDEHRGQRLLEIGAARSAWLPYFAQEYGFAVAGIDYSELGCAQASAILDRAGVEGQIVCADFFAPPEEMVGAFDALVSFGVIEHFQDTARCVEAFARFLRPGGVMTSVVPNLGGIGGFLQKRICREIFDVHVILDDRSLRLAHESAGLYVQSSMYFIGGGFVTMNMSCRRDSRVFWAFSRLPTALTMPFLMLERVNVRMRPNRLTSPYMVCIAHKPTTA